MTVKWVYLLTNKCPFVLLSKRDKTTAIIFYKNQTLNTGTQYIKHAILLAPGSIEKLEGPYHINPYQTDENQKERQIKYSKIVKTISTIL